MFDDEELDQTPEGTVLRSSYGLPVACNGWIKPTGDVHFNNALDL